MYEIIAKYPTVNALMFMCDTVLYDNDDGIFLFIAVVYNCNDAVCGIIALMYGDDDTMYGYIAWMRECNVFEYNINNMIDGDDDAIDMFETCQSIITMVYQIHFLIPAGIVFG